MALSTTAVTDFITARVEEDEQAAQAAGGDRWAYDTRYDDGTLAPSQVPGHGEVYRPDKTRETRYANGGSWFDYDLVTCDSEGLTPAVDKAEGVHIARQDPKSTLDRCTAIRDGLAAMDRQHELLMHASANPLYGAGERAGDEKQGFRLARDIWLRTVAAFWSAHPDYDESWKP